MSFFSHLVLLCVILCLPVWRVLSLLPCVYLRVCMTPPLPGGADICLKETMSLADSLYNLQLVQEFCRNNLNHCCHFSLEDMLYAHASVKVGYALKCGGKGSGES